MLLIRAFWLGILLSEVENIAGYYSSVLRGEKKALSSKLPLQINCSDGVPIPPFTIDKLLTRDEEKQILQRFYFETSGYGWTIKRPGWTPYDNGTEIDHCHWAGVTCDEKSGYVTGLCLNNNNLTGHVPNFLWKLRNLMLLCLPSNPGLRGELKDFVFKNMSKLLRIDLAFCSLTGELPNDLFSSLNSLVKIQLCCQTSNPYIHGSIPPSITDLKDLKVLSLGENSLSGPIPQTMGKLTKVWFLDLEFMPGLSGKFSDFLGMASLKKMHLTHAGINGELPDNFGSYFPEMKECQLGNNSINGSIPSKVNKMKDLTKLLLCANTLRGKIPKELGELPSLRILDLSDNSELQGIEKGLSFRNSPKLEIFVLRNNPSFTMAFEDLVHVLAPKDSEHNPSPLRILDICYCGFTGKISPMIWTFSNLIELHLKHNRISGTIPAVLDDLLFLSYVDFSENQNLEGAIPNTFVPLLQSLRVFDIRNNPLMRAPVGSINLTSGTIQEFMRIDPNSQVKGNNFRCPLVRMLSNNGKILLDPSYYYKRFCVCDNGFFGYLGHCKKCISGAYCSSKTLQDTMIFLNIQKGYWPSPSPDNVLSLIPCPGRQDIGAADLACNPGGDCKCWVNTSSPELHTVCNKSCICHSGNTGRLCSKCAKSYFKNGYVCEECANSSDTLSYPFVIPLFIVFLLALWGLTFFCPEHIKLKLGIAFTEFAILFTLQVLDVISGWIFEVSVLVVLFYVCGMMKNTRGILAIFVFHFQILDAIISNAESPFPAFVYRFQHYMSSIFNLKFHGISCSIHVLFTPLGKYLVVFLFPLGCLLLIWLRYGIRWMLTAFSRTNEEQPQQQPSALEKVKSQCLKVSIACLNFTFFPVMKHTLEVISPCDSDVDSHTYYMRHTPWMSCDNNDHPYQALQVLGWIAIILYGGFQLVGLGALLRWWSQSPEEKKKDFDSWLGSVYLLYKDKVKPYFEVMKLSRKLLIAILLTFIPNTCSIQTFVIALVLMIALIYQIKVEPYKGNFENFLEKMSLIALQQSVILLRFASYDSQMGNGMVWTVFAVNTAVLVPFGWTLLSVLINACSALLCRNDGTPLVQEENGQQQGSTDQTVAS